MSDKLRNKALLILVAVLALAAMWTLIPGSAPKANDLGYFSFCPFAPWSTLMLLFLAGLVWVIRQYFLTRPTLE